MLRKISTDLARLWQARYRHDEDDGELDFSDGPVQCAEGYKGLTERELDAWQATSSLEALHLESVVAPYMHPMRQRVISREQIMSAPDRPRGMSLAEHVRTQLDRRPSTHIEAVTSETGLALLSTEPPLATPTVEKGNPFDEPEIEMAITPFPARKLDHRRTRSMRSHREMPLRVQAMRRMHQQAFINQVLKQVAEEQTPVEQEERMHWQDDEDLMHWSHYNLGDTPPRHRSPEPATRPPLHREQSAPQIYYDPLGRPFI